MRRHRSALHSIKSNVRFATTTTAPFHAAIYGPTLMTDHGTTRDETLADKTTPVGCTKTAILDSATTIRAAPLIVRKKIIVRLRNRLCLRQRREKIINLVRIISLVLKIGMTSNKVHANARCFTRMITCQIKNRVAKMIASMIASLIARLIIRLIGRRTPSMASLARMAA
jgi:hypothetical protein